MRVVYIADDGKQFNTDYECEIYEFKQKNGCWNGWNNIKIYKGTKLIGHPMEDDSYNNGTRVVLSDAASFKAFHNIAAYCGWCEWEDEILSPGDWRRLDGSVFTKKHWYNVTGLSKNQVDTLRRKLSKITKR